MQKVTEKVTEKFRERRTKPLRPGHHDRIKGCCCHVRAESNLERDPTLQTGTWDVASFTDPIYAKGASPTLRASCRVHAIMAQACHDRNTSLFPVAGQKCRPRRCTRIHSLGPHQHANQSCHYRAAAHCSHQLPKSAGFLRYQSHLVGLVFLFHLYIVQARPNKTMSSKDRKSDGLTYGNKQQASKMNASVAKLTNVCWLVTLMLGLAVICLHLGRRVSLRTSDELIHAEHVISEAAHRLAIRAECNATGPAFESAADAMTAVGFSGSITASQLITITSETLSSAPPTTTTTTTESPVDTVSVSTQTSMTTLDGVSNTDQRLTITATTTGTTTITLLPVPEYTEASYGSCQATVTETVWVTVYPPSDATVTASLSTFTTVNTVVSYTAGLPDVTISGNPSTYTAVQTDTSFTSGPPDATVSGDASTVTDIRTDVSVTSGLPDATVSGGAATVTDMQTSWTWPLTTTYSTPFTTITISDLWGPSSSNSVSETEDVRLSTFVTIISSQIVVTLSDSSYVSSEQKGDATSLSASPTSTYTLLLTTTGGPPAVETTTVDVFPPAYAGSTYNTTAGGNPPSSTSSVMTPVVVSGGNKKPEPKAWGGSNGSSNLACTVMLIAVIMFMS